MTASASITATPPRKKPITDVFMARTNSSISRHRRKHRPGPGTGLATLEDSYGWPAGDGVPCVSSRSISR
jgi:hypothetical protein